MWGSTKSTRRKFLAVAGLAAASSLVAACGGGATPTAAPAKPAEAKPTEAPKPAAEAKPAAEPTKPAVAAKPAAPQQQVKLRYLSREPIQKPGMQDMWAEFRKKFRELHPNLDVEHIPTPANYVEQMLASVVAGTAPEVMEQCCWVSTYMVQQGHTMNLQPYIKADAKDVALDDYYKYQFDAWKDPKGDIHLLANHTGTQLLYYNKDMFQQKGVPFLPKTWDENIDMVKYAEIGNKFKVRSGLLMWGSSNYGMTSNWVTQYHLRAHGANMVDPKDPNRSTLDDPKALESLESIRKWIWDDKWFAYGADMGGQNVQALFSSGRLAMMEMGPWQLTVTAESAKFKWDVAPMPKGPAGQMTHQSVDGIMGFKGSKYQDETWLLLKDTASPWSGRLWMRYGSRQPSRKSLLPEFPKLMREMDPKFNEVNLEVFGESLVKDIGRPEEMFNNDKTCKDEILKPAFDKVMLLNQMPVDTIAKAAKIVEKFNTGKIGVAEIGKELNAIGIK